MQEPELCVDWVPSESIVQLKARHVLPVVLSVATLGTGLFTCRLAASRAVLHLGNADRMMRMDKYDLARSSLLRARKWDILSASREEIDKKMAACGVLENAEWGTEMHGLRIGVTVDKQVISAGEPFLLEAILQNVSGKKMVLQGGAYFLLGHFWCPVDMSSHSRSRRVNEQREVALGDREFLMWRGDLSKLGWDSQESSIWPRRDMYSVVAPGERRLVLEFQMGTHGDAHVRSNETDITISEPSPSSIR